MRPGYSLSPLVLALSLALAPAAQASTTMEVTGADGSVWATLSIGDASDNAGLAADEAMRSITSAELQAVKDSIYYWSDVLGAGATVPVIEISPLVTVADNASAGSDLVGSSGETLLQAALLGHDTSRQEGADREPTTGIELYAAASIEREALTLNPLSRNGMSFHLTSIIVHEVMHALGMVADVSKETGTLSDEGSSLFASHLVDVYGTSASQGVTFQTVTEDELKNLDGIEHGTKSRDESVFYVLSDDKHGSEASGVKFAGTNVTEVIGATTAIYYADTDFLVQNEETGTWSVVDPTIANSVIGGIPVNGNEGGSVGLELSHLELQNSLMSHQSWRNWALPMEAELAVLQDLGYTIDRKRYFGTSIYSSGSYNDAAITISQAFWAREAGEWVTGVASTQTGAVGVHVYGSLNEVTIAADQLADGAESFGVRVDGQMNDITLDSGYTVSANGTNGTGIAFTYGNSHTLTLEAGSTVSAAGEGGKALVFDFGSNLLGNSDAYRGSYINASVSSGYWTNTARLGTLSAIDGALVETVNISGAVSAPSGTAIYISENALVSTINVKSGATISGDIVSEWNAQSTVAFFYNTNDDGEVLGDDSGTYVLQAEVDLDGAEAYEGSVRAQKEICEGTYGNLDPLREILAAGTLTDLTTNMVFGDSADFEFTYSGTISGAKGLRLTFAQGTSVIEGDVSVLSVTINAGATLRGDGTWTMTPMSGDVDPTQASSFGTAYARAGDNTSLQGYLENNGTLYATGATGHITIDGDYVMGDGAALVLGVTSSGAVTPLTVTGAVTLGTASSSSDSDEAAAVSDEASSGTYTVRYVPEESYFRTGDAIDASSVSGTAIVTGSGETVGTEVFTQGGVIQDADILGSLSLTLEFTTPDSNTIEVTRLANAYSNLLDESASETERSIAKLLDNGAETAEGNAQTLIASLDFTTDRSVAAAAIADLKGDAHVSAVRSGFAVERLVDRTLARVPADAAVSGRHVWLQPFGGRLADNAAGAHSRTKAAGLAGGVTVTEPGKELGWQMAAAYFSESNNLHAKTRGEGFWLGASAANAIDADGTWWLDLSGRIGLANVKTERYQTVIGSTQEVKGTRWSATLGAKVGPRLELADLVSVRPAVGLIGTVLRTPSKTEDKVGGLAIEDSWYRSLRAQAGVALETAPIASAVTGFSWKWTANAGYERELMKDAGEFKAGLAGMNGTFGQRVDWNDRNRWLIGGGLELANEKGFTAAVRLEGELTHGDGAAVTGGAELRWQF